MSNNNWDFHHIGIATTNLQGVGRRLERQGFDDDGHFVDEIQGVSGKFMTRGRLRVELLESLPGATTLNPWLAGGNRCYQVAFEVSDLDGTIEQCLADGARLVRQPLPAVAFGGRRVAFVMPFPGFLFEFIEKAL